MAEVGQPGWLVLDTGGLLALAHNRRQAIAATKYADARSFEFVIPAVVLTQCIRGGPRDAPINRFIQTGCELDFGPSAPRPVA